MTLFRDADAAHRCVLASLVTLPLTHPRLHRRNRFGKRALRGGRALQCTSRSPVAGSVQVCDTVTALQPRRLGQPGRGRCTLLLRCAAYLLVASRVIERAHAAAGAGGPGRLRADLRTYFVPIRTELAPEACFSVCAPPLTPPRSSPPRVG